MTWPLTSLNDNLMKIKVITMEHKGVTTKNQQQIQAAAKQATQSRESACFFLKSAGIMTAKGNLSPKYK